MTLADLKRIKPGTRLLLVESLMGPQPTEKQARTVRQVQSNAIASEPDWKPGSLSWLYFPKAADFRAEADGFTILEDGEVAARYVFA